MMKRRGVTIILIITAFVIFFYGYRYLRIPVNTMTARITQIEDVISADAFISRQEVVYNAQNAGTMYSYVTEGARVSKNMCIATVYRGDVDNELIQELNNIDKKIKELEDEKKKSELFVSGNSSAESKLENIKKNIIDAVINNDIGKMKQYKSEINHIYNKDSSTSEDTLTELSRMKRQIEMQLGGDKGDIYSTMSGVFSRNVDGMENVLSPENIMSFTVNDFNSLVNPGDDTKLSNKVSSGEAICKVVDNHVWYAIAVMPIERAEEIKNKKNLLIRFDALPGTEVSAEVCYISSEIENEGVAVVILESQRYLEGVYGIRAGEMDIVVNRYTGFEVPVHSIRIVDGKKGVVISKGSSEVFCECDVIYTDMEKEAAILYPAENAVVKLSVGDKILLGEKTD